MRCAGGQQLSDKTPGCRTGWTLSVLTLHPRTGFLKTGSANLSHAPEIFPTKHSLWDRNNAQLEWNLEMVFIALCGFERALVIDQVRHVPFEKVGRLVLA